MKLPGSIEEIRLFAVGSARQKVSSLFCVDSEPLLQKQPTASVVENIPVCSNSLKIQELLEYTLA